MPGSARTHAPGVTTFRASTSLTSQVMTARRLYAAACSRSAVCSSARRGPAANSGRKVRRAADGPGLDECWLLAEWPPGQAEPVPFWLSDLPADTTLVRLAKLRRRIEHDYREMKQALGLAHFASAPGAAGTTTSRADKAYASRENRAYLRRRGIRCTIPDKTGQARNRRSLAPAAAGRRASTRSTTASAMRSSVGSIASRGTGQWLRDRTSSPSATKRRYWWQPSTNGCEQHTYDSRKRGESTRDLNRCTSACPPGTPGVRPVSTKPWR